MHGDKIRMIRELRGFSQEHMASELGIEQHSYSRIETNKTKLTVEVLEKIASVLGVSTADILSGEPVIINFATTNQGVQHATNIEHFYATEKELLDKLLLSKDEEIAHLRKLLDNVMKDKQTLMDMLRKEREG